MQKNNHFRKLTFLTLCEWKVSFFVFKVKFYPPREVKGSVFLGVDIPLKKRYVYDSKVF